MLRPQKVSHMSPVPSIRFRGTPGCGRTCSDMGCVLFELAPPYCFGIVSKKGKPKPFKGSLNTDTHIPLDVTE